MNMPNAILALWVFAVGAAVGSFLNVCIVRLPKGLSLVKPGSHCPSCQSPIRFYDNIPLLSYLILRGKCRKCKASISPRYFLVEGLSGLNGLALFRTFGLSPELLVYFIFFSALLVIIFIDLDTWTIPDLITLPGIVAGVAASFLLPNVNLWQSLLGLLAGGGVLFLVAMGYQLLRKREGMGGGDIKLLAMIGAFLGLPGVIYTLFASSLAGSLVGVLFMFRDKSGGGTKIPFGPFLALGAMTYVFWGPPLIHWYLYRLTGPV
ncbi:MAG: prepilin peptidase [Deltaproteobacteria bacterium]|nr:prepilin peptidase [Deltaproteobacteria bacterium]